MSSFRISTKTLVYANTSISRPDFHPSPVSRQLSSRLLRTPTPRGLTPVPHAVSQEDMLSAEKRWNSQVSLPMN